MNSPYDCVENKKPRNQRQLDQEPRKTRPLREEEKEGGPREREKDPKIKGPTRV